MQILTEPKNALVKQFQRLFEMEECDLEFREDALLSIAKKATERKTGARGLRTLLEKTLLETMYDLPSIPEISKVVIDKTVIESSKKPLLIYDKNKSTSRSFVYANFLVDLYLQLLCNGLTRVYRFLDRLRRCRHRAAG